MYTRVYMPLNSHKLWKITVHNITMHVSNKFVLTYSLIKLGFILEIGPLYKEYRIKCV